LAAQQLSVKGFRLTYEPVPLRVTTCGVLFALSLIFNEPVIEPLTHGANLTCMLQLFLGRTGAEHAFVWVKPALALMLLT